MSGSRSWVAEMREWCFRQCREAGMRRTRALEAVVEFFLDSDRPASLGDVCAADRLANLCDQATVYRLLTRLEAAGVIRRLGFHRRAAFYALRLPGRHDDYLVCTECGTIRALKMDCPVADLEQEVSRRSGFAGIYHELEFFGICPQCR